MFSVGSEVEEQCSCTSYLRTTVWNNPPQLTFERVRTTCFHLRKILSVMNCSSSLLKQEALQLHFASATVSQSNPCTTQTMGDVSADRKLGSRGIPRKYYASPAPCRRKSSLIGTGNYDASPVAPPSPNSVSDCDRVPVVVQRSCHSRRVTRLQAMRRNALEKNARVDAEIRAAEARAAAAKLAPYNTQADVRTEEEREAARQRQTRVEALMKDALDRARAEVEARQRAEAERRAAEEATERALMAAEERKVAREAAPVDAEAAAVDALPPPCASPPPRRLSLGSPLQLLLLLPVAVVALGLWRMDKRALRRLF